MNQSELIKVSLIDRLRSKGIDVSGFERVKEQSKKGDAPIPLDDDICSYSSIYVIRLDGSLWTVKDGQHYKQVRQAVKKMPRPVFVCVRCKAQAEKFDSVVHK